MKYLTDLGDARERVAVRRAFLTNFMFDNVIQDLGLTVPFYWAILEIPKAALLLKSKGQRQLAGDIDILIGKIEFTIPASEVQTKLKSYAFRKPEFSSYFQQLGTLLEILDEGLVRWPPPVSFLAGIEVKSSFLRRTSLEAKIASGKSGPGKMRKLANELFSLTSLGLDRAALLDVIATPPQSSLIAGQAFLKAGSIAIDAEKLAKPIFKKRPISDPRVDHWRLAIGAVDGGTEESRGSAGPAEYGVVSA